MEDLGSTNGTYVDGRRIQGPVRLTEGARLRMGTTEFELQPAPADTPAVATPAVEEPVAVAAGETAQPGEAAGPEKPRSLGRRAAAVVMAVAAIATVAVLASVFSTSSSSGTSLASAADVQLPPPSLVPFVTPAGGGQTVVVRRSRYSVIAPSQKTGGAFTLLEIDLHHGSEPPPHIHHRESEGFYLLRGTMVFQAGTMTLHAGPGDFVYLPKNVLHAYTVTSGVAHVLLLSVPAGGLDRFFVALSQHPALARQLGQQYGIQPVMPGKSPRGAPGGASTGSSGSSVPALGSIPFITHSGKGLAVKLRGSTYFILADTVGTGGAFGFLYIDLHHGSEPPAHIHHHEAEVFYLVSGTMSFSAGGKTYQARAGDLVYLPKGLQHAYEVTSGVAHVLLLAVPAGLEQFFKALSQNPKLAQQLGAQYGIQPGAAPVTLPPIPPPAGQGGK